MWCSIPQGQGEPDSRASRPARADLRARPALPAQPQGGRRCANAALLLCRRDPRAGHLAGRCERHRRPPPPRPVQRALVRYHRRRPGCVRSNSLGSPPDPWGRYHGRHPDHDALCPDRHDRRLLRRQDRRSAFPDHQCLPDHSRLAAAGGAGRLPRQRRLVVFHRRPDRDELGVGRARPPFADALAAREGLRLRRRGQRREHIPDHLRRDLPEHDLASRRQHVWDDDLRDRRPERAPVPRPRQPERDQLGHEPLLGQATAARS